VVHHSQHRTERTASQSGLAGSVDLTETDTIAAIATAPGRGGVGILRISGPAAESIAVRLTGRRFAPRQATLAAFLGHDGQTLDQGLVLFFPPPGSYTAEPVVELHAHGSPVVLDLLLARVLFLGARLARPGEFTERAFLNGKLDLTQAEAVADLIASTNAVQARLATRTLQGALADPVRALQSALTRHRVHLEAGLDFSDEDIEPADYADFGVGIQDMLQQIDQLIRLGQQGERARDGLILVIAGAPNAGKSSLLNQLAGESAAIVSELPGTTRDPIRASIHLDGLPLHLVDTAGLRDSGNAIEQEGMRRARKEILQADLVLWVYDALAGRAPSEDELRPFACVPQITLVRNKLDLLPEAIAQDQKPNAESPYPELGISAQTGAGLAELKFHIKQIAGYQAPSEGGFIARRRHVMALEQARAHLGQAGENFAHQVTPELVAEDLRLAQTALATLTGEFSCEDLLSEIFSGFCIGK
jgi:tRNA modification GTPase